MIFEKLFRNNVQNRLRQELGVSTLSDATTERTRRRVSDALHSLYQLELEERLLQSDDR